MQPTVPPQRPADVRNAMRRLFASLIIEIGAFAFSGTYDRYSVIGLAIGAGITFFLLIKTNQGCNWARYMLAALVVAGLIAILVWFGELYRENPGETVLEIISTLITLVATVLLFSRSSNTWYALKS